MADWWGRGTAKEERAMGLFKWSPWLLPPVRSLVRDSGVGLGYAHVRKS